MSRRWYIDNAKQMLWASGIVVFFINPSFPSEENNVCSSAPAHNENFCLQGLRKKKGFESYTRQSLQLLSYTPPLLCRQVSTICSPFRWFIWTSIAIVPAPTLLTIHIGNSRQFFWLLCYCAKWDWYGQGWWWWWSGRRESVFRSLREKKLEIFKDSVTS